VFTADGSFWLTIFDHTTATPFDAGANDGMGHSYYSFIFSLTQPNTGIIKTTSDAITTILAHAEKYVRCNSSTGTEITILSDATADHVIGTVIEYRLGVSGMSMTFVPETGGVTINYPEDDFDLVASKKGAVIAIRKVDDDEWDVFGLLDPITGS
jgi:hypothetical protein